LQSTAVELVVAMSAIGSGCDELCVGKDLEVLRHLRLTKAGGLDEVGHG